MLYGAAALALLAAAYLFLVWPRLPRRDMSPFLGHDYAHRGLWNTSLPENSLPAFHAAAEGGFGIETDVRMTKDGELVLFHDASLARMCGVDRQVNACTLRELRQYRLSGTGEPIPTLNELLEAVDGRVPLILEIKPDRRVKELCAKVQARMQLYAGAWCMESFHPLAVRWFRQNAPQVIRGQLAYGLRGGEAHPRTALSLGLAALLPNAVGRPDFIAHEARSDCTPAMALMRRLRPWLVAWTVRSQEDMDSLRARYDLQIFEGFVPKR